MTVPAGQHKQTAQREDFPCPYSEDGRTATIEYLSITGESVMKFDEFLASGYRRLGGSLYRNVCRGCTCCLPIRVETAKFLPGKSQRRTLRKNHDIRVSVSLPDVTREKIGLYRNYLISKHAEEKSRSIDDYLNVLAGLHFGFSSTLEVDYFDGDRLFAVGIVDAGRDSLSSNYFYYDTDYLCRRPGVFSILQEIFLARRMGKRYYYLGFLIEENPKMSYKKLFLPNQVYEDGNWKDFLPAALR